MSAHPVDIDAETIQFDGRWMGREDLARAIRQLLDAGNYNVSRHSLALESLTQALSDVRTVAFRATPQWADAVNAAAQKAGRTPGFVIREAVAQYLEVQAMGPKKEPEGKRQTEPEIPIAADEPEPEQAAAPEPAPGPDLAAAPDESWKVTSLPAAPEPPPAPAQVAPPPGLKPAAQAFGPGPGALRAAGVPHSEQAPNVMIDPSLNDTAENPTAEVVTEAASPEEAANAVDLTPKQKSADGEQQEAVEQRWFGG